MERVIYKAFDNKDINLAVWDKVENPKAVVQILHGMAEHMGRYDDFACFLNKSGYIVLGDDHRAHGLTDIDNLGKTGEGDLFENTVKDEIGISKWAIEKYKLPLVTFGHSYGSFLMQRYLLENSTVMSGCILTGSAFMRGAAVKLGRALATSRSKKHIHDSGKLFAKMTFISYDKKFREGLNAWLSRDIVQVGKYNTDNLCGFTCSNGFYKYFFNGLRTIYKADLTSMNKDLKLMIASGGKDYVGGCSKLTVSLFNRYKNAGLNPQLKIYSDARHEILNETNNAEVYCDLLKFIYACVN